MYPVGLLFGLGFDTASEIGLLALAAGIASQAVPKHEVDPRNG
jgi:high-affinity nickel-transport protein